VESHDLKPNPQGARGRRESKVQADQSRKEAEGDMGRLGLYGGYRVPRRHFGRLAATKLVQGPQEELAALKSVFHYMSEPFPHLIYAVQIAWDYLEKTGQIDDGAFTSRFLMRTVEDMILTGERRRLLLSNRAIAAYERLNRNREVAA
jgi:hypothetical protein